MIKAKYLNKVNKKKWIKITLNLLNYNQILCQERILQNR